MTLPADILNSVFGRKPAGFESFNNKPNRGAYEPFIRCSVNQSGGTTVYTSARMEMRKELIQIEIDRLEKRVRLRIAPEGEAGTLVSKGGVFSGATDIYHICGSYRVLVSLAADGWWYGRIVR